jgi:agmatinase
MLNYGGLEEKYRTYETSKIVIIPVPYDGTSTWVKGSDKGPDALLEASMNMELYDIQTDSEVYLHGIHTMEAISGSDNPEIISGFVKKAVEKVLNDKKLPVVIGGEHSVSIGSIQAAAEKYKNLTILQIDAHADLRDEYEGSKYNHACVMARAKEVAKIVQVGIRSMSVEEKSSLNKKRVFWAHDILSGKSDWSEKALDKISGNVYITIDLDGFDPSCLPATGTPEPGGLDYPTVTRFLQKVIKNRNLVGFDVVELCPIEGNRSSEFLASKLIYQLLCYQFKK